MSVNIQQKLDEAMAEATRLSAFKKLNDKYEKLFRELWMELSGGTDMISVSNAMAFAERMVSEGWKDWSLSESDVATLKGFNQCGGIPLIAFARFSEDDNFSSVPYLMKHDLKISIGNTHTHAATHPNNHWTVYVREITAPGSIKQVTFKFPSTTKLGSVTCTDAPFEVDRQSVGEFKVNIEVTLNDGSVNEYSHMLCFGEKIREQVYNIVYQGLPAAMTVSSSHGQWLAKGGSGEHISRNIVKANPVSVKIVDMSQSDEVVSKQLLASLKESGFAYLVNHGVKEKVQHQILKEARSFFAQKHEAKQNQLRHREHDLYRAGMMKCARGYTPPFEEALNPFMDPDNKESFDYGTSISGLQSDMNTLGINKWPQELLFPTLKETCENYLFKVHCLGEKVLEHIGKALGLQEQIEKAFDTPLVINRLLKYPPQRAEATNEIGAGSHVDYGALTFILQDSEGLEVFHNDSWQTLPVVPNSLVLNTGFMMEKFTNGNLPATKHRVVNRHKNDRHSVATFYDPNPHAIIEPQLKLPHKGKDKFTACTAGHKGVLFNLKKTAGIQQPQPQKLVPRKLKRPL